MTKEKVSSQTKWTEHEKLKVLLSIYDASSKVDWSKVYIPEGRSIKAVRCMLDGIKNSVKNGDADGAASAKSPSKTKAVPAGTKRKRPGKQPEREMNTEEDDEEEMEYVKKPKNGSEEVVLASTQFGSGAMGQQGSALKEEEEVLNQAGTTLKKQEESALKEENAAVKYEEIEV